MEIFGHVQDIVSNLVVPQAHKRLDVFQSLGGNCEFGFVQRSATSEPSGLLRFSWTPIESLIHALATDFVEFGQPGDLWLDPTPTGAYYCASHRYGIRSNIGAMVGDEDPIILLERAYGRTTYMKRRMLEDLAGGKKIFVRKLEAGETQEQFDRLVREIHRHGPSSVLQVREDGPSWTHKLARRVSPGVIEGSVRKFASIDKAWDVEVEPWLWLCDSAYALHHSVSVEALFPPALVKGAGFSPKLQLRTDQRRENGVSIYVKPISLESFRRDRFYLFQTWVWIPDDFSGSRIFATVGHTEMHGADADLTRRNCWQRVWRAGHFPDGAQAVAPVGLLMNGGPADTFWSFGAQFYDGTFPKFVEPPTFRPPALREVARRVRVMRSKRKHTSAIVAIAKDEDPYILEWLAYHLALGVDHIWVYDNGSRIPIESMLSSTKTRGRISVVPWKDVASRDAQLDAYEHFMRNYGRDVEWTAVIDVDEFICLPRHKNINRFLAGFRHANGIILNWRYFGSSGQERYSPGLLMDRFTRASPIHCGPNTGIKAIYRTAEVDCLMHHYSTTKGPRRICSANGSFVPAETHTTLAVDASNFAVAQLNHYFVKSKEEWQRKITRGYSWVDQDRSDNFEMCDLNDCEDLAILSRRRDTVRLIERIRAPRWQRHGRFMTMINRRCSGVSKSTVQPSPSDQSGTAAETTYA